MKRKLMYDVVWIVNGQIKEHLAYNKPRALANWIKRRSETSTHKSGKVILKSKTI